MGLKTLTLNQSLMRRRRKGQREGKKEVAVQEGSGWKGEKGVRIKTRDGGRKGGRKDERK